MIDCFNIVVTSYGFMINFFPIYSSMRDKSNGNATSAVTVTLVLCFTLYAFFSTLGFLSFGHEIKPSIFDNLREENSIESIFIRVLFLSIFLCNIPYIFMAGKEFTLTFIYELRERYISR